MSFVVLGLCVIFGVAVTEFFVDPSMRSAQVRSTWAEYYSRLALEGISAFLFLQAGILVGAALQWRARKWGIYGGVPAEGDYSPQGGWLRLDPTIWAAVVGAGALIISTLIECT